MKKRKKEDKNDDNKEKKKKKTAKTKCKFRGEEFLGPQASLRVTPLLHSLRAYDCRSTISKLRTILV